MKYSMLTGAVLLYFLGLRTIINLVRDCDSFKLFLKYTAVIIISTLAAAAVNYAAAGGYRNLAHFAALPLLSVAAGVALSAAFKLKKRAAAIYLSLMPAGTAFLAWQYAQNYTDMLLYTLKSSLEFFIAAVLIFKIYKKMDKALPEAVKGAPAILIITSLITIIMRGLIR